MTCIVGLKHKGDVYIGGDSAGVAGNSIQIRTDPKVFHVGDFVFGFTSSFRMGQLLQWSFKPPKHPKGIPVDAFMKTIFINALKECFNSGGFGSNRSGEDIGGTFLVGYKEHLFYVDNDYQVGEVEDDFVSVGSGSDVATGAMYALSCVDIGPMEKVEVGLAAAARFTTGVRPPFKLVVQKRKNAKSNRSSKSRTKRVRKASS